MRLLLRCAAPRSLGGRLGAFCESIKTLTINLEYGDQDKGEAALPLAGSHRFSLRMLVVRQFGHGMTNHASPSKPPKAIFLVFYNLTLCTLEHEPIATVPGPFGW